MGLLDAIQGDTCYLDTNIWIYALEGFPAYAPTLTELLTQIDQGNLQAITSELTLAETLVRPLQLGNQQQQLMYQQAIANAPHLSVIPVRRDLLIQAAKLRATTKLKLPDAIHAATVLGTHCTSFLTNDPQFKTVPELTVIVLSEAVPS
jgi:predicted nucleic acid-binding protein